MTLVLHCPCGYDASGETEDDLVAAVEAHVESDHPDKVGTMSREDIIGAAHEH